MTEWIILFFIVGVLLGLILGFGIAYLALEKIFEESLDQIKKYLL